MSLRADRPAGEGRGLLALLLLTTACASAGGLDPAPGGPISCCAGERPGPGAAAGAAVTAQYLGVGGWLFRRGDDAILAAPFYSNPSVLKVGFWIIRSDTALVDRMLAEQDVRLEGVSAILVGHAHYDHLMDVPRVALRHLPGARIYGSRTARHILEAIPELRGRVEAVDARAGDDRAPGRWYYAAGGRIRFMPLRSGHAPHFLGIELFEGRYFEDRREVPDAAWDWVKGRTLAYLIDFLEPDGTVGFRIHYADAAHEPPEGFLPPGLDRRPVDLAVLCAPGFDRVDGYPEGIVRETRPRHVFLGHWEDFFRSPLEPPEVVPTLDLGELVRRLERVLPEGSGWTLPRPGATFLFRGRGGRAGGAPGTAAGPAAIRP